MQEGLRVHKPGLAFEGYTLFCGSCDDPRDMPDGKPKINLVDMEGNRAHVWEVTTPLQSYCWLLPNGNLLYPTHDRSRIETAGIREIAPDGTVLWSYHCRTDHDFQVLDNGNLVIHCIADHLWPELGPELKRNPYIIEITREKELVWHWRGEEHLAELEALLPPAAWAHVLERVRGEFSFDWAHNNTCQIIPPNATHERELAAGGPVRFRPGNIVFSYRSLDIIGVIERPSGEIVWAWGPGVLDGQHKPHMLPNGNLLIFDNGTLRGWSRVIEVNPLTEEIEWEYTADPKEEFLSKYISGAQRLPNGNTLICEGGKAHLFEVTRKGEIVWSFVNPWREPSTTGSRWHESVYRCLRYSPEHCEALLGA